MPGHSRKYILPMFDIFRNSEFSLFLVGGTVRDRLLGIPPGDCDYATDGRPQDVIDFLSEKGVKVIPTGVPFGTVTAIHPVTGQKAEITTFRASEVYRRGSRNPMVRFGDTIEEDLRRRDFTINAMAMDEDGNVIDPFGGRKALTESVIDTPGNPNTSFSDDPLRILRAYRFAAKLGFRIAQRVRRAARDLSFELETVSAERKYKEITGLLASFDGTGVANALDMMKQDGVLMRVIPEMENLFVLDGLKQGKYHDSDAWHHTLQVVAEVPPSADLRWAALLHDCGKGLVRRVDTEGEPHFHRHDTEGEVLVSSVAERLRFSRARKRAVALMVRNHMRPVLYDPSWTNSAVRRLIRDSGDQLQNLMILAEADIKAHSPEHAGESLERLAELRERLAQQETGRIIPDDMGHRLKALGFEGPVIGRILDMLEDMAADGILPENPTVDQCFSALWDNQKDEAGEQ